MAAQIRAEVKAEVEEWVAAGKRRPQLTAVIVGEDPASKTYIKNKMNATKNTGNSIFSSYNTLAIREELKIFQAGDLPSTNFVHVVMAEI